MEDIRLLVREEGRTARNLVAYQIPLDPTSDTGKTLSRKPPTSPRPVVETKKDEIAIQRCCDSPKPGLRTRSASTGRDKKSALQARYWAFIFENLKRAVTEIYLTCESDESESECKEAILVLENYTREFHNLIEWLKLKSDYENTSPRQWPPSLAWGVRKSNMGQIRDILDSNHLFGAALQMNTSEIFPSSSAKSGSDPGVAPSNLGSRPPIGTSWVPTDACRNVGFSENRTRHENKAESRSSNVIPLVMLSSNETNSGCLGDSVRNDSCATPVAIEFAQNECSVRDILTESGGLGPSNSHPVSVAISQLDSEDSEITNFTTQPRSLGVMELDDVCSRAVGTQTQCSTEKQPSETNHIESILCRSEANSSSFIGICDKGEVKLKEGVINKAPVNIQLVDILTIRSSGDNARKSPVLSVEGSITSKTEELVTSTAEGGNSGNCKPSYKELIIFNELNAPTGEANYIEACLPVKIKVDQGSQTDMELCVEEGSEAIRFVLPPDPAVMEEKEVVDSSHNLSKQPKKALVSIRPNYAAVSSLRTPHKPMKLTPRPTAPGVPLKPNPHIISVGLRSTITHTSNYLRPSVNSQPTSQTQTPPSSNLKAMPGPTARPALIQVRHPVAAPQTGRLYMRAPLLPNTRRGPPMEPSPLTRGDRQPAPPLSRRVPSGLDRRSHSTLSSSSLHSSSSVRSVHSVSSNRSWADKVKNDVAATVSVEVLPRTGAGSQEDDQGWETVKGRSRSRYSLGVSRARLRFNQPSAASSLPALALSEVELCPHSNGSKGEKLRTDVTKTKVLGDANLDKKAVIPSNTNNIKKSSKKMVSGAANNVKIPVDDSKIMKNVINQAHKAMDETHATSNSVEDSNVSIMQLDCKHSSKLKSSQKKSPTHEKGNKEKSNVSRERAKMPVPEAMDDKDITVPGKDGKEETADVHSDLEVGLDPGYQDILQEGEQLSNEEAELRREIQELETADFEFDMETEDEDTKEEKQETWSDIRSHSLEDERKGGLESKEPLETGDTSEEIESLEARYETVLVGMSWAERMDTLEQLQEYVSRHPGRATELHQKLSSPSRRKTIAETLRKFQLKQIHAQEKREMMQREKAQRLKELHDRVAEVKVMQEANIAKRRVMLECKLKNAECRRNLHLKGIVRKAHDEEQKVKELAFITELEAQNKRIDFINQCQKQEVLVQGIYEERQRKLEEKAAKEAAAEERRRVLEAERQEKIERMQELRRERMERMGRAQQEKEKSRQEQAREKARDREERLSALHAAQIATVEELQKKIQQKQEESARRHEENMEQIRQRALESSILRTDDVAPLIQPYPVQKMCGICHVLIGSEVYLLSHLRGRTHQEAVLKLHEGAGKEDIPMLNIRHIVDAPADKLNPRMALDKKRQAALKKRCKKIRQRMATRGREFETSHETPTNVDAPNKPRIFKCLKDIEKLLSCQGKGQWPNNAITALERALGEINRILTKPNSQLDQSAFQLLCGFTTVSDILLLGLDVPPNMAPYLPAKCFATACNTLTAACKNNASNSAFLLLGNKITTVLDLLLSRLVVLIPGAGVNSTPGRLPVDVLGDALMRLLALVLSVAAPDSEQVSVRVQDVISYTVSVGVVDKLALYCGSVKDPVDGDPGAVRFLLSGLELLTTLTARCRPIKGDPTQLLVTLQLTELVGAVSMLYGMLLHQGAPPRSSPPAPLPSHATEVALATVTLLSRVAELDLPIFQSVLGAEGISLQFRHIASFLLWYCSHDRQHSKLLHCVVRVVGFFAVNHRDNQMMLQSGYPPTVLQQLCSLPLEYFREPLNGLLFPTLLACCADNDENRAILEQEVCYESLEEFKHSDASRKNSLMKILTGNKSTG